MNLAPTVYQFLSAATREAKDGQLDTDGHRPYPGFEPGTFGSASGFPNHFTAGRLYCNEGLEKIVRVPHEIS